METVVWHTFYTHSRNTYGMVGESKGRNPLDKTSNAGNRQVTKQKQRGAAEPYDTVTYNRPPPHTSEVHFRSRKPIVRLLVSSLSIDASISAYVQQMFDAACV